MENIKEIFIDKDVNNGIILFISNGQDNDEIINIVKKALNLKDTTAIEALKAVYNYFKQSIGNEFHSTKAIRTCLSSTEYSNGVSYFGRIPLSHIIAVYDIKGNKIEWFFIFDIRYKEDW